MVVGAPDTGFVTRFFGRDYGCGDLCTDLAGCRCPLADSGTHRGHRAEDQDELARRLRVAARSSTATTRRSRRRTCAGSPAGASSTSVVKPNCRARYWLWKGDEVGAAGQGLDAARKRRSSAFVIGLLPWECLHSVGSAATRRAGARSRSAGAFVSVTKTKKRKRTSFSGTPAEHRERGERSLQWAAAHLREARAAKACGARVHHAMEALTAAAEYGAEMKWRPRPGDEIAIAANLRRQAVALIDGCVR